jgi:ATP-binding cassette subfamily C protein CydD
VRPLERRLLRMAPAGLVLTGVLGVARALLAVSQALLLAHVLAAGFEGTAVSLLPLGAVLVLRGALGAVQDVVGRRCAAFVKSELRRSVLERATLLGPRWLQGRRSGELATSLGPGTEALDGYFVQYLPQLVLAVLVPAAVIATLGFTDWRSAVIIGVTVPLLPVFLALVGMHTKQQTAHQWRELARLGGHFLDVVSGLPTLRVFGRTQAQVSVLRRIADEHRQATVQTLRTAFLSALVLELVATLSVAVLAVSVGFRLLSGHLDLETALLVLLLAPEAFLPLRAVGTSFHAAASGLSAAETAFAVLDEPLPAAAPRGGFVPRQPLVRLEGVTVREDGRTSLNRCWVTIHPGEQVALVGPSGSGKSTVLSLVLGLLTPTEGRVLVDELDLADLDVSRWHSQIAWVPQFPHLFARSVADNVRLGRPGATDAEVRVAARAAHAEEFVEALPRGFDTVLGEGGRGLSVGQQRRLAVARAFLCDAPLLLLDEPTAGLDADSEAAVSAALQRLCEGRTVLLATHRTELITASYRVVHLEAGARV